MKKYVAALALLCVLSACADRVSSSKADIKSSAESTETSSVVSVESSLPEQEEQTTTTTTTTTAAASENDLSVSQKETKERKSIYDNTLGLLGSIDDLNFRNTDGENSEYQFDYNGEVFTAIYTPDNWKIVDSYKITNSADMLLICQALIDENPLHGRDMVSYRVPDDMVDEWMQHNLAYEIFYENAALRARAKDVDLNPDDQGKNIIEKYAEIAGLLD